MSILEVVKLWDLVYEGDFTLSSGHKSGVYFDIKSALLDRLIRARIEKEFQDYLRGYSPYYPCGIANAGYLLLPLVSTSFSFNGFVLRKAPKTHGLNNRIDGFAPAHGSDVILVDDVITSGKTLMNLIRYVESRDCKIKSILCVVDRIKEPCEEFAPYRGKVHGFINV